MLQRLLILAVITCSLADPRSPRIYNVLITSKKNLAPSQAVPVYEPVLRTTSLGYAFSPFVYTHVAPLPQPNIYAPQTEAEPNFIRQQVDGQVPVRIPDTVPENRYAPQTEPEPNFIRQQVDGTVPVRSPGTVPENRYTQNVMVDPKYVRRPIDEPVPLSSPESNPVNRYAQQVPEISRAYQNSPQSEVQPVTYAEREPEPSRIYQNLPQGEIQPVTYAQVPEGPRSYPNTHSSRGDPAQSNPYPETAANVRSLPSNVVPLQQYVPYYTPLGFPQYFPSQEISQVQPQRPVAYEKPREENDPKQIVANFRRNPGIPDVPPPPLPVKTS